MSYFTIISNALISLSRIFTVVSKGSAGMGRINKVFEEEPHLWVNSLNKEAGSEEKQPIHILFDHVTFSYSQASDQKALQDISFCLERGKTLGIMGETGSGKSTLISLILRIYDADSGTIQINGRNIQDIPTAQLRSSIGTVFQNDFLFSDTIAENIRFGRDLSSEEIDHALLVAQAKEFVSAYSDGTNHWLDIKGANLSGGQRQRLLIARAVAGRPEILILDDSSSALDYRTDATLRKALSENFQNITTILIAQRISSICHADQILMLEKGRCIGYGTHQELLERCPAYRKIYETQIGGICLE
jgi:ATP-binding cassette subfamily B protein